MVYSVSNDTPAVQSVFKQYTHQARAFVHWCPIVSQDTSSQMAVFFSEDMKPVCGVHAVYIRHWQKPAVCGFRCICFTFGPSGLLGCTSGASLFLCLTGELQASVYDSHHQ